MSAEDDDDSSIGILTSRTPTSETSVLESSDSDKPRWNTQQKLVVIGVVAALGIIGVVLAASALMTGNGPAETEAPVSLAARRLAEIKKISPEPPEIRFSPATKRRHANPVKKATKAKRKPTARSTRKRNRKTTRTSASTISFTSPTTHTSFADRKSAIEDIRISNEPPEGPPEEPMPRTKTHVPTKTTDSVRRMVPQNGDDGASRGLGGGMTTSSGKAAQRQSSTDLPSVSSLLPSVSYHSNGTLSRSASDAPNATKRVISSRVSSTTPSSTLLPTVFSTSSETILRTSWGQNGSAYANFSTEDPFTLNDFLQ